MGRDRTRLEALAAELGAGATVGDVTNTGLFAQAAIDAGEALAGLVYAVGTITLRNLSRLTEADFLNDFQDQRGGAALAVQAALPALRKAADRRRGAVFQCGGRQRCSLHASVGMAKAA